MTITKRYGVPKFWPIEVKAKKYVVSPRPGPHSKMGCAPLGVILRDILKHGRTMKEVKQILGSGAVKINGAVRKDHAFPVGLMDVVDVGGDFYRLLPDKKGLNLFNISPDDAEVRLAKIRNKTYIKKNKVQLNLHDGSNIVLDKDDYRTSDVIVLVANTIKDVIRFEKGAIAVVTDGHNAGLSGTIESIDKNLRSVVLSSGSSRIPVPIKYVFVVGRDKPVIKLNEATSETHNR